MFRAAEKRNDEFLADKKRVSRTEEGRGKETGEKLGDLEREKAFIEIRSVRFLASLATPGRK